jgi:hypothetical protein
MGGVEGLCEHIGTLTDAMLEQAQSGQGDNADGDGATHDAPAAIQ